MDIYKRIYELENEIAALPQGSINMKKIYGKEQPYLQWTENGKSKSKYIKKIHLNLQILKLLSLSENVFWHWQKV